MEETPHQAQETPTSPISPSDTSLIPRKAIGLAALGFIGIASGFFIYSYLDIGVAAPVQAAAVATTTEPIRTSPMEARAAFVLDITSGTVLYQRNADVQLPLASLTKVLLALAVSEVLAPDRVVTIPREITAAGTSQRLAADTSWRVRDVLTFTLVTSSNEGAEFLATLADDALRQKYPVAPASGATLWRMNNIAAELGLSHTYFLNVSGLDASETEAGAYGSARDVATVMAYAASTSPHVFAGTTHDGLLLTASDGRTATASNTNEALGSIQGVMMGKTGYTDLAGGNLAIVFDAGLSHPIVAVVLGSSYTGRFTDMKSLVAAVRASLSGQ